MCFFWIKKSKCPLKTVPSSLRPISTAPLRRKGSHLRTRFSLRLQTPPGCRGIAWVHFLEFVDVKHSDTFADAFAIVCISSGNRGGCTKCCGVEPYTGTNTCIPLRHASMIASECLLLSLSKSTPESLTLGADLPIQGDKSQKCQRKASTCKACGASGHNSANPRCPAKKQRTGGSGSIAGNGGWGGSSTSSKGVEVNEDYLSSSEGE